jgi:hypothetical protein
MNMHNVWCVLVTVIQSFMMMEVRMFPDHLSFMCVKMVSVIMRMSVFMCDFCMYM